MTALAVAPDAAGSRTGGRRARRRDARLVPVAAGAWIAGGTLTVHAGIAGTAAAVLWVAAAASVMTAIILRTPGSARGRTRAVAVVIGITFAVAAAVATHIAAAEPNRARVASAEIAGGRALSVEATAVGKIERSAAGWRFDAVIDRLTYGDTVIAAPVPVLIRTTEAPDGLDLGARVRLQATAWRAESGQRAVLIFDAAGTPELISPPAGVLASASALRRGLTDVTNGLPNPGGGLISGLAVGDTSGVAADLDDAMKASSLSHLTAVSGANCALVVGIAFALTALCGARRAIRVVVGLSALVGFVVLVSPEPSVVRAAAMAAIAMLGVLMGRTGAGLSLLTAAVILLLVLDPWLAWSLGFALSVAATAALLVGAGPLADGLARWMPRPIALGLSVPLSAQLACGPLIVLIAPQVSLYGVIANVLAAPAAPVGTVLGLAACLTAGVPLLGAGLAALAWLPAAWIAGAALTISAIPGNTIWWPEGLGGLIALAAVGLAVAALILRTQRRWRMVAGMVLVLTVAVGLGLGPVSDVAERARLPGAWSIAACDIGQGDAVVVRSSGQTALIDTGPDPAALRHCLDTLGVGRLDLLVLTHFDHDHDGGSSALAGRVATVLHGPTGAPDDERTLRRLADGGARLVPTTAGMTGRIGNASWRALWPRKDTAAGNDGSVVVDITGPDVPSALFLGDLSADGQRRMAGQSTLRSSYAVVKVSHHGSADQDPKLYARLRATVALVSVGQNTYGHPRTETLAMLSALGTRVDRTDQEGLVVLWREGDALRVWSEKRAP